MESRFRACLTILPRDNPMFGRELEFVEKFRDSAVFFRIFWRWKHENPRPLSNASRVAMASSTSVCLSPASYRHTFIDIAGVVAYRQEPFLSVIAMRPSDIYHPHADAQPAPALQDTVNLDCEGSSLRDNQPGNRIL
jgi:hypothetical protein